MEDLVGHKLLDWLSEPGRIAAINQAISKSGLRLTRGAIRTTMNDVLHFLTSKTGSGEAIELGYYRAECPEDRHCVIVKRSRRRIPRNRMSLARWTDWDVPDIPDERVEPAITNRLYTRSPYWVDPPYSFTYRSTLERNLDLLYKQLLSLIVTQCLFAPQEPLAFRDRPLPSQDTHCRVGDTRMTYDSLAEEWRLWIQ